MDAERRLRAHLIVEVVVLCGQHLGDQAAQELQMATWDRADARLRRRRPETASCHDDAQRLSGTGETPAA